MNEADMSAEDDGQAVVRQRSEIAKGLTLAAAQMRFTTRRARYEAGYADRVRARSDRIISFLLMIAIVLIPNTISIGYFGWLASDQYVVETRLLVRPNRGLGAVSGGAEALAKIEVARETQVVADFLIGATLAAQLRKADVFTRLYQHADWDLESFLANTVHPDPLAGLSPTASAEDVKEYWEKMTSAEIEVAAGVIIFSVKAFSAEAAVEVADRAIRAANDLLVGMNATAWSDAAERAEAVLSLATERLIVAQSRMTILRDETGSVDVETEAGAATTLVGRLRETLAELERDYAAQSRLLDATSPRIKALERQIETLRTQIRLVEDEMTTGEQIVGQGSVSSRIARFAAAEVEVDAAQAQFIEATATYERTRQAAELQASFLDVVSPPRLPQSPTRPRRVLWILSIFTVSIFVYWATLGLISATRRVLS